MTRPVSIFLSSLFILGMIQLDSQLFAQSSKTITNSIGMKLVRIPKGTFQMGSPPSEEGSRENEHQHEVTISQDYYLGAFEVTQAQYEKVMGSNPSFFQGDKVAERHPKTGRVMKDPDSSNYPVETVSWDDAVEFCKELSNLPEEKKAGRIYRLPTEAEWEYACRAGSKTAYSFGANSKSLGDYAWFAGNSGRQTPPVSEKKTTNQTHPVGGKKANKWGLYDMHGNVLEWCSDWGIGEYPKGAVSDPVGPAEGSHRLLRGGCWLYEDAARFRSAYRDGAPYRDVPTPYRDMIVGFRVALSSN